jgi:hypothetical protein
VSFLIRELLTHVFGRAFGEVELLVGLVLAFALWCLDYAIIERRRRPRHALVLLLAATTLLILLSLPQWDGRTLIRIGVTGVVYYGLFWLGARAVREHDRSQGRHGPYKR